MNEKKIAIGTLSIATLVLVIILISVSFKRLNSIEYGLEYDRIAKFLDDAAKTGGLHVGPPGFQFVKFPSTFVLEDLPEGLCVSQDGLRIQIKVSFQYQMPQEWLYDAVVRYRDFQRWQQIVIAAGQSAVQHSCSKFIISEFQNKRGLIQSEMEDALRLKLEGTASDNSGDGGVYAKAISVQLRNIQVPPEYTRAVAEKQSAEEDITLAINQRSQETTKADTMFREAKEEAKRINDTATNEAEVILTEASLKAEETTFIYGREAEVLSDVKNTLGLTNEGLLAYMSNEFYGSVKELRVSLLEPVQSSWQTEL